MTERLGKTSISDGRKSQGRGGWAFKMPLMICQPGRQRQEEEQQQPAKGRKASSEE